MSTSIKLIAIDQLRPGMYVNDVNCAWMDHPFTANHFMVEDEKRTRDIRALGVRELYIDTARGLDVIDSPTVEDVREQTDACMTRIAEEAHDDARRVDLAREIERAVPLHREANRIVRDMLADVRLGKQVEIERIEPLVESMVDSIFRNQDALLPLARLKQHDGYTFQHSVSVCALMVAFARGLGLQRAIIKDIGIGALLHDVGKARVPDAVLNKPAKLTEAEFAQMKSHVVQSIVILQNTPGLSQIALDVAGQHHERYDGTGYPNKLKGAAISLYGRMAAIVDVYDAISSDRVYHKGMSPTAALGRLLEWSKYHFDPTLVRAFVRSIGIYPTGTLVRLQSDRLAIVVEQHPDKLLQPKLNVIYQAAKRYYLEPEMLDLTWSGCQDRIVGHEEFADWGIDPRRWLPA